MQNQNEKISNYIALSCGLVPHLADIRKTITDIAAQDGLGDEFLAEITGGKMLRPLCILLCGSLYGPINDKHIAAAAAAELIHYASLVHDDIVDDAQKRRNQSTVRAQKGDKYAVIFGDRLISCALKSLLASAASSTAAMFIGAINSMCRGEMLQNRYLFSDDITEQTYLEITELKTAAFFGCCCRIGALLSGAKRKEVEKCRLFGENFGMAFQIGNDLIDYKTAQNDTKNGQKTLPSFKFEEFGDKKTAEIMCHHSITAYRHKALGYIKHHNLPTKHGLFQMCRLLEGKKI